MPFVRNQNNAEKHPTIVLVGQPNCGKSTLFNHVSGYISISSNFPGTTVDFTKGHVTIAGETFDVVDLPGIYSLNSSDPATEETKKYLFENKISLIINIVDTSLLSRNLELTLQLLEIGRPMVLCLNMVDEADRKGVKVDENKLAALLQIPIMYTIANKGIGVEQLFGQAIKMMNSQHSHFSFIMTRHVEKNVMDLAELIEGNLVDSNINARLAAIKLLEGDRYFQKRLSNLEKHLSPHILSFQERLSEAHGQPADMVISAEYHSFAMNLFKQTVAVTAPQKTVRTKIDNLLMHSLWGYLFMLVFFLSFFIIVFKFGSYIEKPILDFFTSYSHWLTGRLGEKSLTPYLLNGIFQGISGGLIVVLPYLLPFLIGMAIIEDVGYLPRMAFLVDGFMHRLGLHGTAFIPGILGYGCTVPAIMATRILGSSRDRFIASVITILIPCSARMFIILGLVGFYLGGVAAFFVYFINIIVVTILAACLARLMPEDTPGMIMHIPSYQWPQFKNVIAKTWLRIKDFLIFAWPILIIGSILLSLSTYYHFDIIINALLSPFTFILGLPRELGITLIFGILRKELSLVMLMQALGTPNILAVLSPAQIMVFTLFIVFYFPCLATWGILVREIGWRKSAIAACLSLTIAIIISVIARFIVPLFF